MATSTPTAALARYPTTLSVVGGDGREPGDVVSGLAVGLITGGHVGSMVCPRRLHLPAHDMTVVRTLTL